MVLTFFNGRHVGRWPRPGRRVRYRRPVYDLRTANAHWIKRYIGKHDVYYPGYNEGKGIWGLWEIPTRINEGGFHIWPEGFGAPGDDALHEEARYASADEVPAEATPC